MGQENLWKWGIVALIAGLAVWIGWTGLRDGGEAPFGGAADVAFAEEVWAAMSGYAMWPMSSDVQPGGSPHGAFVRLYYGMVHVAGDNYHLVIKDNFGGEGATIESVTASPGDYLAAVTVMVQREAGYDDENADWFWAKYLPDGTLDVNDGGVMLAGRVAKGAAVGCIACHTGAEGGDYLFTNDL